MPIKRRPGDASRPVLPDAFRFMRWLQEHRAEFTEAEKDVLGYIATHGPHDDKGFFACRTDKELCDKLAMKLRTFEDVTRLLRGRGILVRSVGAATRFSGSKGWRITMIGTPTQQKKVQTAERVAARDAAEKRERPARRLARRLNEQWRAQAVGKVTATQVVDWRAFQRELNRLMALGTTEEELAAMIRTCCQW